jgi:hypothetical protein
VPHTTRSDAGAIARESTEARETVRRLAAVGFVVGVAEPDIW